MILFELAYELAAWLVDRILKKEVREPAFYAMGGGAYACSPANLEKLREKRPEAFAMRQGDRITTLVTPEGAVVHADIFCPTWKKRRVWRWQTS